MTHDRRLPLVVAVLIAALVLAVGGYAIGRATAPDATTTTDAAAPTSTPAAMRNIGGVAVGVLRTRAGALAAADNYAASATETIVQRPADYERLVRNAYAPQYQGTALSDGKKARAASVEASANFAAGGRGVAIVGARRLDSYDGARAQLTLWVGGIVWGPRRKPSQSWGLSEVELRWVGDRWLLAKLDTADRPAPAPTDVRFSDRSALTAVTFDRELRAMSAPVYGG